MQGRLGRLGVMIADDTLCMGAEIVFWRVYMLTKFQGKWNLRGKLRGDTIAEF